MAWRYVARDDQLRVNSGDQTSSAAVDQAGLSKLDVKPGQSISWIFLFLGFFARSHARNQERKIARILGDICWSQV
jgi:hypothetical protein